MKILHSIFILCFLLIGFAVHAQVAISGKVLNSGDNKSVSFASVFLDNTTIGVQTSDDGTFRLPAVKPGKYNLVVSFIAFETYKQQIEVGNADIALPVIKLQPKPNALNEVTIRANTKAHQYFDDYYTLFKQQFLGSDIYAGDCKILNPGILDFDYDDSTKVLSVSSADFLQIRNDALGYQLKYLLSDFSLEINDKQVSNVKYQGQVLFTEMKGSPSQENLWRRNRREVYEGSAIHFLRSLVTDRLQQNGFRVLQVANYRNPEKPADSLINARIQKYSELKNKGEKQYKDSLAYWTKKAELPATKRKLMNTELKREEIIYTINRKDVFAVSCNGDDLFITYSNKRHFSPVRNLNVLDDPYDHDNSLIQFNESYTIIDRNGTLFNPYSLSNFGAWGRSRVSELLPTDYEAPDAGIIEADTLLNALEQKINAFSQKSPVQEKVYLHLDKPNYTFGDTIWYKAYTVIGATHQLSALSGVLYVELISPKDSLVTRQMLPLVSGISWSDIPLDVKLKPGTYRIRAYTRWMGNKDDFFEQKVVVGGVPVVHPVAAEKPDVQFFPEGGELVAGVRSRVAVKAIGVNGLGVDIKGSILDNSGTVITDFATTHLGMGEFAFVPEAGKTYKVRINSDGEAAFTIDLPKASDTGYVLSVNNNDKDSVYLKVATNEQTLNKDKGQSFYIIAQNNGKVYYTTQGKLDNTAYTAKVEKSRFPMGITQFTLFDQNDQPVAERIAFVNNQEGGELKLDLSTEVTDKKTKISITATDKDNKPKQGSFSMAVINDSKVQPNENEESTIINNLLLTSELKGYIEQPNYYFTHITNKTETDLDNLMLTQGYRRYDWKQLLTAATNPTFINPERSQQLNGILTTPGGKAIPNGKVTLLSAKNNLFRDTTADENGTFTFDNLAVTDTATLVIKARKVNNGSNVIIKAIAPEYPKIGLIPNNDAIASVDTAKIKQQYEQYNKDQKDEVYKFGKQLKEVKITGLKRKSEPDLRLSSNMNGPGHANQVIMYDQLGPCINLADCMNGKAFGVSFKQDGRAYNNIGNKLMTIIVDGIVLDAHASLNDLNSNDVYSIEILRGGASHAIYGSSAPGGALVITMKHGGEGTSYFTQMTPNGITTIKYTGFYKAKAFFIPKFEHQNDEPGRTTLYWNPNILSDKDGKASVDYPATTIKGTYRVVIEGIDDDGNLGRAVYWYNVQ